MPSSRVRLVAAIHDDTWGRAGAEPGNSTETPVPTLKSDLVSHSQQGATYEEWMQNLLTHPRPK